MLAQEPINGGHLGRTGSRHISEKWVAASSARAYNRGHRAERDSVVKGSSNFGPFRRGKARMV